MTRLSIKPEGSDEWKVCMQLNFSVQYKVHLYISALTNMQKPAAVFIDKMQFADTDPPSSQEVEILQELMENGELEEFNLQGIDIMHAGNKEAEFLDTEEKVMTAYNN